MIPQRQHLLLPTILLACGTLSRTEAFSSSSAPKSHRIAPTAKGSLSWRQSNRQSLHQVSRRVRKYSTHLSSSESSSTPAMPLKSSWGDRLASLVSKPKAPRPSWAPAYLPTWLLTLRPLTQFVTVLLFYFFHISVLVQRSVYFPFQLIPNERGCFQSIGLDSLAGMLSLVVYQYIRRLINRSSETTNEDFVGFTNDETDEAPTDSSVSSSLPVLLETPEKADTPWRNIFLSKYARVSSFLAICALFQAYFWTGRLSLWWEDTFYYLANFYPITVPMHRSLCVLFGHLSWIAMGATVLRLLPRPQNFFRDMWYTQKFRSGGQWVWWTIGGYLVSCWFFNIADFVNQWVLPISILEQAQESVVSQLINPEMNDKLASVIGYIAPCVTAPWWEEVLYRGFLLPALVLNMKYKWAVLWSGIIFSIHHMSPTALLPLAVLGWTWSILYAKSGNLLTTILVHAMWNSRVFLGSWLGL